MDIDKLFKVMQNTLYLSSNFLTRFVLNFKVPNFPAGGNKRKLPDNPTPELLKKMKMDTSADMVPPTLSPGQSNGAQGKGKARAVTIEDVQDEEDPESFAPDGDADYFMEEDDEGRFFGGGLTSEQKEILNIFDSAAGEGIQDDVSPISLYRVVFTDLERFSVGCAVYSRNQTCPLAI